MLSLSQTIYIDIFTRRTRFPWKIAVSCGNAVKSSGESRNKITKIKACRRSGAIFFQELGTHCFKEVTTSAQEGNCCYTGLDLTYLFFAGSTVK